MRMGRGRPIISPAEQETFASSDYPTRAINFIVGRPERMPAGSPSLHIGQTSG